MPRGRGGPSGPTGPVRGRRRLAPLGIALLLCANGAQAQASHIPRTLDWSRSDEVLTYRTCGCADACWVAEVTDRRTHILKARLRCDCETLLAYRPLAEPARTVEGRCEAVNASGDKFGALRARLQGLLGR